MGDFDAGAALLFPSVRLVASYTNRSREFAGQVNGDKFVSLNLSFAN